MNPAKINVVKMYGAQLNRVKTHSLTLLFLITFLLKNIIFVPQAYAETLDQKLNTLNYSKTIETSEVIENDGSDPDLEIVILDSEESLWNWADELIELDPLSDNADDIELKLYEMIQNHILTQRALTVKVKTYKRTCAALEAEGASEGTASWYGPGFHGRKTANGERFNQNDLTAAHKTLPFNSIVEVTYKGKTVRVRINDAGPYSGNRIIDLSKEAARQLGLIAPGTGRVTLVLISCGVK